MEPSLCIEVDVSHKHRVGCVDILVRVDSKGRIVIPSSVRSRLGIKDAVRLRVEGDRLIIEPVRDPIEALEEAVVEGTKDVEAEIKSLRGIASREALRRIEERW